MHLPYLWVPLLVHQVTLLGFSHEAMSARKLLEEALADAPYEVNGFCYTADEFKALGFSDVLIAAMKDTTVKRAVSALVKGHLLMTGFRIFFMLEAIERHPF